MILLRTYTSTICGKLRDVMKSPASKTCEFVVSTASEYSIPLSINYHKNNILDWVVIRSFVEMYDTYTKQNKNTDLHLYQQTVQLLIRMFGCVDLNLELHCPHILYICLGAQFPVMRHIYNVQLCIARAVFQDWGMRPKPFFRGKIARDEQFWGIFVLRGN